MLSYAVILIRINSNVEDYMLSVGTPWTMDYNRGAPDTWNVTRPINAEEAEVYGIETGLNWEFYPATGNFRPQLHLDRNGNYRFTSLVTLPLK